MRLTVGSLPFNDTDYSCCDFVARNTAYNGHNTEFESREYKCKILRCYFSADYVSLTGTSIKRFGWKRTITA